MVTFPGQGYTTSCFSPEQDVQELQIERMEYFTKYIFFLSAVVWAKYKHKTDFFFFFAEMVLLKRE